MKKILVFLQSGVGGAERMTVTVTKSLNRKKCKLVYYVVDLDMSGSNQIYDFIPRDIEIHHISKGCPLKIIWHMFKAILYEKPYSVFTSALYLNNKILLLRFLFWRVKFIIRCENYLYTFSNKQRTLIKYLYPRANIVIAQTDEMKSELLSNMRINPQKIVVLQNPIDYDTITNKIELLKNPFENVERIHFLAVGRFAYQKGFDLLIKAYADVVKSLPNSELCIIGETGGPNNQIFCDVINIINEMGLNNNVYCIGYKDNPYVYMANADCFVLSSRWEGLPNVLIESLYLGTPVAAFECIPIIRRIIDNGKNGYIATKGDVYSLSTAMINAVKLGRVKNTYKSAKIEDFHEILIHATLPCDV